MEQKSEERKLMRLFYINDKKGRGNVKKKYQKMQIKYYKIRHKVISTKEMLHFGL